MGTGSEPGRGAGDTDASPSDGLRAEQIVWIFCSGRTGSTWLGRMLGGLPGCALWDEPRVGALYGEFYFDRFAHARGFHSVAATDLDDVWLRSIRDTVLGGAAARFPDVPSGGFVVAKEPHGTMGAPLLSRALPASRLILLVRDPRDVVASALDAHKEGNWARKRRARPPAERDGEPDIARQAWMRAQNYLWDAQSGAEAFVEHPGPKALVRYEDLRADAEGTMRALCTALALEMDVEAIAASVARQDWDRIPEDRKGPGKQKRKAKPGAWRDDLTAEQVRIVEEAAAPVFEDLYPDGASNVAPSGSPREALRAILASRPERRFRTARPRMMELRISELSDQIVKLRRGGRRGRADADAGRADADGARTRAGARARLSDDELASRIAAFPRWHYEFDLRGQRTPIHNPGWANRHRQRRAYFFEPLLERCGGSLQGKRVLDLGCNAGWWSLQAIEAGCEFVLGVDGRRMHVEQAELVFEALEIEPERYELRHEDVFDLSPQELGSFDVVLCLGLLYHVHSPVLLLERAGEMCAGLLVIDTAIASSPDPILMLGSESSDDPRMALKTGAVLVPSAAAVVAIAEGIGFDVEALERRLPDGSECRDYADGRRRAFLCARAAD